MRSIVLLILLAGCATGSAVQGSNTVPQRQTIFTSEQGTLVSDPARAEAIQVDAPPLAVWAAVKKVYSEFGIPVTLENASGHQLGNPSFIKTRQVGSEPMPSLVNCGNGMTGPNAASFRMTLSLLTDVNPDGKGGRSCRRRSSRTVRTSPAAAAIKSHAARRAAWSFSFSVA